MKYNIAWAGLADAEYYKYIAQYCLPSWSSLPGLKYVIHDSNIIDIPGITVVNWNKVPDNNCNFLKMNPKKKTWNFWRKMQSQVWSIRNINNCDFLILLDTDIEILEFDRLKFEKEIDCFKESGLVWATGESNRGGHDSGFIVLNMSHPQLVELTDYYENIWESGKIFDLDKSYDGHAVESMLPIYKSYKIKNRDYGSGMHLYSLGLVHWGSKEPKRIRAEWTGDGKSLVEKRLSEIVIKKYKDDV